MVINFVIEHSARDFHLLLLLPLEAVSLRVPRIVPRVVASEARWMDKWNSDYRVCWTL